MIPDLANQLRYLDALPAPTVRRFDPGPPLAGSVAVLPAAYNPPTLAHLHLLAMAASETGVNASAALLSTRNVDKGLHGATLAQRVEMLRALHVSDGIAVLVTNQARLVDQSLALTGAFPGVAFDFVVGYDTLVRVFDARYYGDMSAELAPFFAGHRLIATNRAEHSIAEVARFVEDTALARQYRDRILIREVDDHHASLSSTRAREHTAAGPGSPDLPPAIAAYIRNHGLYRVASPPLHHSEEGAGG